MIKRRFVKKSQINTVVFAIEESRRSIVATLHDVLRDVRQVDSSGSRHCRRFLA
jgi:hypothetical protein